ncbi:MAG: nitrilase family protein [Bacteroidales bacterium]|nr:nitrilase family protein [Bacteroidales bacterium]
MMKVHIISLDIVWEDKQQNFRKVESVIEQLEERGDLIILPEMFSTGFTMKTSLAEDAAGETLHWMIAAAQRYDTAILGSFPYSQNGREVFNRAYFVKPDGSWSHYDKRHLFRMGDENNYYTRGEEKTIVEYKGVKFALNICYDIRFPVWSRNKGNRYDVLVNIANFPEVRINAIEPLLKARAIENLSYALFANRDGKDPMCVYCPSSQAYDFKGNEVGRIEFVKDSHGFMTQVLTCDLDIQAQENFRDKFPAWMDADTFNVIR